MTYTKKHRFYRVLTDREVQDACDLRGVDFRDGNRVIFEVIPALTAGGWLRRYYTLRSALGSVYGRWEVVLPKGGAS